ncbi:hypothetical protein LTR62_008146 [Meristemomyces frigidus]|uniref:Translation initiation factor IF-2, mitochondrial n=1 Tax=Meristemomyces frigidus TaxID=1508187 RepID=A0AAN7T9X7_9PEZI|nr:hypothetical protein LTR62_008146 [Meristemomyces frigidus]
MKDIVVVSLIRSVQFLMRRQRYLRTSSAQLCIFCACALSREFPPAASALTRRGLHTGPSNQQQAEAVASSSDNNISQQQYTFDPKSTLSRSEQAERARLRQAREQRQRDEQSRLQALQAVQQQRDAELQRIQRARQEAEAKSDREAQERIRAQWRSGEVKDVKEDKPSRPDRMIKHLDLSSTTTPDKQTTTPMRPAAESHGSRVTRSSDRQLREERSQPQAGKASGKQMLDHTDESGPKIRFGGSGQKYGERKGQLNRGTQQDSPSSATSTTSAPKLDVPKFGGPSTTARETRRPADDDWGGTAVQRTPVQYAESRATSSGVDRERAGTAKPESVDATHNSTAVGSVTFGRPVAGYQTTQQVQRRQSAQEDLDQDPMDMWEQKQGSLPMPGQSASSQPEDGQPRESGRARSEEQSPAFQATPEQSVLARPRSQSLDTQNTSYRATMLDTTEYQPRDLAFNDSQSAQWQHLKRRESVPTLPSASSTLTHQQTQQGSQPSNHDWIERSFRKHQRERGQQAGQPAYYEPPQPRGDEGALQYSPFHVRDPARTASQKCARCGEVGHIARQCSTMTCFRCGKSGHRAAECTERSEKTFRMFAGTKSEEDQAYVPAVNRPQRFASNVRPDQEDSAETAGRETAGRPERLTMGRPPVHERFVERAPRKMPDSPERRAPEADDVRQDLLGRRRVVERPKDDDAEPEERVLRSRKFNEPDAPPKKDKVRASRRRDDDEEDDEGGAERDERNARKAARKAQKVARTQEKVEKVAEQKARRAEQGPPVNLPEFVSVATLAQALNVRYEAFVSRVERLGYDDVFPGKILNKETSGMIAMEYGFEPVFGGGEAEEVERDLRARPAPEEEDRDFLPTRPPVVTIMGHVDHGKTTLLDFLRKTRVVDGEAGGITQHIGAFSVAVGDDGDDRTVTFLDTPGHAAFLAMRQRGANVTDIVILVVAADDGVKPQTIEAIRCARTAGVPIIVAVNKIDKEGADVERVKGELTRHGIVVEDFGGDTVVVPVSGKTGQGMTELVEAVVVSSEVLDKRAEVDGLVEGWVLEGTTRKAGRVATVLVKRGTLRPGNVIVAGRTWGRVKTLRDQSGRVVPEVGPGMPVEVDGWRDQPVAGDEVLQAETEQKATDVVEYRLEKEEQKKTALDMEAINETRRIEQERAKMEKAAEAARNRDANSLEAPAKGEDSDIAVNTANGTSTHLTVPFIIKADVSGSAEAVSAYVLSISSPLISPQILRSAVGPLTENDIDLASAAQGHIISFSLPSDERMKGAAERQGVKVLENNVIYRVLDDVKAVLEEKLPPVVTSRVVGEAEVGVVFEIGVGGRKKVKIAGCKVRNGVIGKGARARVMRVGAKVYEGTISSLKNVKKDVQEMRKGTECGMGFDEWEGFEVGDQVQIYEEMSEKRRL